MAELSDSEGSTESAGSVLASQKAKSMHLCVLFHGLWGNPSHMKYIESSLRKKHDSDTLLTLVPSSNSGGKTYDGIDVCAERAFQEIEKFISLQSELGFEFTKFSVVGYSLGGLIGRYVVGILLQKGCFEHMKPVNFTTFACPHLGVRSPHRDPISWMFNSIVSTSVSATGEQLCGIDDFKGSGLSLLNILADPNRSFLRALSLFENRSLYANITNDRFAVHYTTSITHSNPYADLLALNINYLDGYESVLLDPAKPSTLIKDHGNRRSWNLSKIGSRIGFAIAVTIWGLVVLIPAFTVYSVVQSFRSRWRLRLVRQRASVGNYHNDIVSPENIENNSVEVVNSKYSELDIVNGQPEDIAILNIDAYGRLELTDQQFTMIKALNKIGFHKHLVHIKKTVFSHSAIVVRRDGKMFGEGRAVIEHWLGHGFDV